MKKITLITGGQRSGKSEYAERLALGLSPEPVYVATARIFDEEFGERVERHRQRRGSQWTNIEKASDLGEIEGLDGRTVLIDCVTLWATNIFFDCDGDVDAARNIIERDFDRFTRHDARYIFVTNETGLGGISENAVQRRFTDLQGFINQYIAAAADEVTMLISGIPVRIK